MVVVAVAYTVYNPNEIYIYTSKSNKLKTTMVWPRQEDARGENTKIDYGLDTTGEKEKRTSKKNVYGRSTSSHDNKKFRSRSMEKQRGKAFGFRKTATAFKNRVDRSIDKVTNELI